MSRQTFLMIRSGAEYGQSAMMPATFAGRGRFDAISTVAAPIDTPIKKILVSGPKRLAAYSAQLRQSKRSLTPKVMTRPSLCPCAR